MTEDQKLELFFTLFSGRKTAYGAMAGQSPVCVREPLTDEVILRHFEGSERIGVYPLREDNTVLFACVDIDRTDHEIVSKVASELIAQGFYPYVESSKSKGFHIWLFFDQPIEAKVVRKILLWILKNTGIEGAEIFPKQDSLVSNNGLGNFIFLPLHGGSIKHNKTVFLDSEFLPYEDQWKVLKSIHLTKSNKVLSLESIITDISSPVVNEEKEYSKSNAPKDLEEPVEGLDLEKYLKFYNIPFKVKREGERTFYLLRKCLFSDHHTTKNSPGDSSLVQGHDGKITYHCFHNHCQGKTFSDARRVISGSDSLASFIKQDRKPKLKNFVQELHEWVDAAYGTFSLNQIYADLDLKTPNEKNVVRVTLHRMAQKGILERGLSYGAFRKIDRDEDVIELREGDTPRTLALKWPGEIESYVRLTPKTIVVVAGSVNSGKTAFLLNTAYLNRDLLPTRYFSSEFGRDELLERLQPFGYPLSEWHKITFTMRSRNFEDVVDPNGLNLVDYLEPDDEGRFFRMGIEIKRIFDKLHFGAAVIAIQKKPGADYAYGGQITAEKARLYLSLEKNTLKIIKAKLWATRQNPVGMIRTFKLIRGSKFEWGPWEL